MSHELGVPSLPSRTCRGSALAQQLHWQQELGSRWWNPACPQGCCCPLTAGPLGVRIWQGPALSPDGGRVCGHRAAVLVWGGCAAWGYDKALLLPGNFGQNMKERQEELPLIHEGE